MKIKFFPTYGNIDGNLVRRGCRPPHRRVRKTERKPQARKRGRQQQAAQAQRTGKRRKKRGDTAAVRPGVAVPPAQRDRRIFRTKRPSASRPRVLHFSRGKRKTAGRIGKIPTAVWSVLAVALAGGSDAVILRHPEAIKTIAKMISALM